LVVVALAVLAVRAAAKRQLPAVAVSVLVMTVIGYAYLTTGGVPDQLPKITPYLTVLAVLLFGTTRLRPPAAESLPWSKGEH
jgi:simple sugar transport system permease protein